MKPVSTITSPAVPLLSDNVDTDTIIPSREMKTTGRSGLADGLFAPWRYSDADKRISDPDFVLNQPSWQKAQILVAGDNFGCGSSREHAPWALLDFGFRAVVSSRFADIFRSNALKNGLLPITVDETVVQYLFDHPNHAVRIDIARHVIDVEGYGEFEFPLDPFSAYCLTRGIDPLDFILENEAAIEAYEDRL